MVRKEMEQNEEHVSRTFCAIQMEVARKFVEIKEQEEMEPVEEHATNSKYAIVTVSVGVSNCSIW